MRIIVFIITAVIQLAAAAVTFLMLLLGMNGYSESQAKPSLIFFIILSLGSALGLGVAAAFAAKYLAEKKSLGGFAASSIAVLVSGAVGGFILVAGFFGALMLAEIVRGMR